MRIRTVVLAGLILVAPRLAAQTPRDGGAGAGYMLPPDPIPAILATPPAPSLTLSPDGERYALLARDGSPSIEELAAPELRLAGVRINPATNGPSRQQAVTGISLHSLDGGRATEVDVPQGARISAVSWSPDGTRLAFVNAAAGGLELWVANTSNGQSRRVVGPHLNGTLGAPYEWEPDSRSLLVKLVPSGRGAAPLAPSVPTGPLIQQSLGRTAPARTYQDLLENPHDERLFEHFFTAQLARIPVDGGRATHLGEPGIIAGFETAPGGEYILVSRLHRPFSYLVPLYRFPTRALVLDRGGRQVREIADLPLAESVPIAFDAVRQGPRSLQWRADAPATLVWVEALDGGDPRVDASERDRVLMLDAPFTGEPRTLITLPHRFAGVLWGTDEFALVFTRQWSDRNERRYVVAPGEAGREPRLLVDRSYEDRYGDPGYPETTRNAAGHRVLLFSAEGRHIYLTAQGASPRGNYPFLDRMDIRTGEAERLWRAEDPYYEAVQAVLDPAVTRILTRRESVTEPPNYFVRELPANTARALTAFPDPAPQLAGIQRELITYPREDGVMLSATLYTPPGYDAARDGPLPMLMWAYPREFRDAAAASQVTDSPNRFSRPGGTSHLFLLTQGYAILDGPAMPIVGEGEEDPNDRYVEQLVASARAAVEKVVEMGVAERDRIGVGGHSYGAFMTANLLAHSDLFAAGIARSGAYNRTLTPFGFQAEQRTYWEAPEIYNRMSPFMHAHQVNEPILLIHGAADNNSGTFPVQSERFYAALKGHGATTRYVVLPHESHGYQARESVQHTLAEMIRWMDTYVKGGN
jgi:dipeptidyl aminopeptidase/acylaminoacyl peptidase